MLREVTRGPGTPHPTLTRVVPGMAPGLFMEGWKLRTLPEAGRAGPGQPWRGMEATGAHEPPL